MSQATPRQLSPSTLIRRIKGGDLRAGLEFVRRFPQEDVTSFVRLVYVDGSLPTAAACDVIFDSFAAHERMRAKQAA